MRLRDYNEKLAWFNSSVTIDSMAGRVLSVYLTHRQTLFLRGRKSYSSRAMVGRVGYHAPKGSLSASMIMPRVIGLLCYQTMLDSVLLHSEKSKCMYFMSYLARYDQHFNTRLSETQR